MTDRRAVEIFIIADNGSVEVPITVAMAAHMQRQRFLKGGWIDPLFKERCRKFLDHPRFDAALLTARLSLAF